MPATVLLCDDEDALRQLVRATLDNGHYEIVEAADGDESLELARRIRPDLVVLDMMMPELRTRTRMSLGWAERPAGVGSWRQSLK